MLIARGQEVRGREDDSVLAGVIKEDGVILLRKEAAGAALVLGAHPVGDPRPVNVNDLRHGGWTAEFLDDAARRFHWVKGSSVKRYFQAPAVAN